MDEEDCLDGLALAVAAAGTGPLAEEKEEEEVEERVARYFIIQLGVSG